MKELIIKVDDPSERAWDGSPKMFETKELVRCKDCKNAEVLKWLDNAIICKKHSYTGVRPDEFYCADGERKDEHS